MSNELKHFGVLGMRWGRRNARSPSNYSPEHIKSRQISKKKVSEMSNEELKILNTRRQLERQYAQLNPNSIQQGKAIVNGTLKTIGGVVTAAATITAFVALGQKIYGRVRNLPGLPTGK